MPVDINSAATGTGSGAVPGAGNAVERLRRAALNPTTQDIAYAGTVTITTGTEGQATTVSNPRSYPWTDALFSYATRMAVLDEFNTNQSRPAYMDYAATGAPVALSGPCGAMTFSTPSAILEIAQRGFGKHKLWVIENDQPARPCTAQQMPATGGPYRTKYDFGTRNATRRFVLELTSGFQALVIPQIETLHFWQPDAPTLIITGDSLAGDYINSGITFPADGHAGRLAQRLGCLGKHIVVGLGACGYFTNNGGTRKGLEESVNQSVIANIPTNGRCVIVHSNGLSDPDSSNLNTAAATVFDAIYAAYPLVPQVVFMPFHVRSHSGVLLTRARLLAVCATRTWLTVIDNTTAGGDPEMTGTGHAGAPNGTGNCDWVISGNQTHPTVVDGNAHIAAYRDRRIRAALLQS